MRAWSVHSLSAFLTENGFRVVDCFTTKFAGGYAKVKRRDSFKAAWLALKADLKLRYAKNTSRPHLVAIARVDVT